MTYQLVKQVRDDDVLRQSFFELAKETFDLSFESWYREGYWSNKYIPYAMVDKQQVIANVSVNIMDIKFVGENRRYIQIGTVMTAEPYRHQGLVRELLNEIIRDFHDVSGIYLFANETVLDFYPQFGFELVPEYQTTMPLTPVMGDFERLNMAVPENRVLLQRLYQYSNPFAKLSATNNYELLMFYCRNFMKDCLYYSPARQVVVVAIQNKRELECLDIFGSTDTTLEQILNEVASAATTVAHLGFTPPLAKEMSLVPIKSDEQLFVYNPKENIFLDNQMMFPLLSHA